MAMSLTERSEFGRLLDRVAALEAARLGVQSVGGDDSALLAKVAELESRLAVIEARKKPGPKPKS
jgi:BMFP domain-containing protein YqiC